MTTSYDRFDGARAIHSNTKRETDEARTKYGTLRGAQDDVEKFDKFVRVLARAASWELSPRLRDWVKWAEQADSSLRMGLKVENVIAAITVTI
jgi:hypothetical protein